VVASLVFLAHITSNLASNPHLESNFQGNFAIQRNYLGTSTPHNAMYCRASQFSGGWAGSQTRSSTVGLNRRDVANIQIHTCCVIDMKVQSELAQDPVRHHTSLYRHAFRIQTILWN